MNTNNKYSIEQIKEMNYTIIDNNVYDLKGFEKEHPGGSKVIRYYMGKNGTEKFYKISAHTQKVIEYLNTFKVGEMI